MPIGKVPKPALSLVVRNLLAMVMKRTDESDATFEESDNDAALEEADEERFGVGANTRVDVEERREA
jgi:hypothetical protein